MKRKAPTLREITAAAIIQIFDIPREHAKNMTTEQILSLVQIDHDPVPVSVAVALGWGPELYNHPGNITLRLVPNHLEKTAKHDIPAIAKSVRVTAEQAAFQRRMLAKSGQGDEAEQAPTTRPKGKIASRPFQKPPEGQTRKLQGRPFGTRGRSR